MVRASSRFSLTLKEARTPEGPMASWKWGLAAWRRRVPAEMEPPKVPELAEPDGRRNPPPP